MSESFLNISYLSKYSTFYYYDMFTHESESIDVEEFLKVI